MESRAIEPQGIASRTTALRARSERIIVDAPRRSMVLSGDLTQDIERLRIGTSRARSTGLRRLLFVWLRIFVNERKSDGSWERVDLRLPIPIPIVGGLLRKRIDPRSAMQLLTRLETDPEPSGALARQMDAFTGFELIRVEENKPKSGKASLVVIGID